jgi:hypothetical protein
LNFYNYKQLHESFLSAFGVDGPWRLPESYLLNCKVGYCDPVDALTALISSFILLTILSSFFSFLCWTGSYFASLGCYLVTSFPPLLPFIRFYADIASFYHSLSYRNQENPLFLRTKANREDYQL